MKVVLRMLWGESRIDGKRDQGEKRSLESSSKPKKRGKHQRLLSQPRLETQWGGEERSLFVVEGGTSAAERRREKHRCLFLQRLLFLALASILLVLLGILVRKH